MGGWGDGEMGRWGVSEAIKLPDGTTAARPFEPTAVYDATWENLLLNWSILGLHVLTYLTITFWLLHRKNIFLKLF